MTAAPETVPLRARRATVEFAAIAAVTVLAAVLRFASLRAVPTDPFYDAAVRSMGLSLHNFFLGAYEPGGSLAVDKPPVDLWLQVLSTKIFGFGSAELKVPPALAGTLAVPVLYDALRRVFGGLAGLAGALVLALLPIAMLTARSDTMDSVSMLLAVVALWLLVRFASTGASRWLYLAAAMMGVAFNTKLFQGLVPLPALVLFAALVCRERRLQRALLGGAVFLAVALSWLTLTLAFPSSQRPYAIGSTNGSAWNAAFVYNGYDRIAGSASNSGLTAAQARAVRPANNSELARANVPIGTPALLRLFDHNGPLSGLRLGFLLLAALVLGVPALGYAVARPRGPGASAQRALAVSLLSWLAVGALLYSAMARLHPRYTEGFTPAVAAVAGIGLAWALRWGRAQRIVVPLAALALALYGRYLLGAGSGLWRASAVAALVAAAATTVRHERARFALLGGALAVAALLLPLRIDASLISHHEYDSGRTGAMGTTEVAQISRYIAARRGGSHYEFVATDPSEVGALIVHDLAPMLSLTSSGSNELLPIPRLEALVRTGAVRFGIIDGSCGTSTTVAQAACSTGARWIRHHSTDVSVAAGLRRGGVLYRLGTR